MNDTYTHTHTTTCPNCSTPQIYTIPKGTTISSFMARQTCRNCGCRMAESSGEGPGRIRMVAQSDDESGRVGL